MGVYMDIHKKFKGFELNLNFESSDGTLGILGASGSGKSMTLKCLAGLETPDEGLIKVGDKVVFDSSSKINLAPQKRNVGYLFQSYALFPNMTVWDNISIVIDKNHSNPNEKIREMIRRYELEGLEDRYPVNISGGQQQRVALARIFAYEPEILLLDEPFSALDSYLRESMQVKMKEIIEEYAGSVIMVTHSRDEAFKLCDDLLIVDDGNFVSRGDPETLFKNPGTSVAAKITGCKNISKIKKISDYKVHAVDWGFDLDVSEKVSIDHTYIGLRAHNLYTERIEGANVLDIKILKSIKGPFEKSVIFKSKDGNDEIWWICNKDKPIDNINKLYVNKNDLLLLKK